MGNRDRRRADRRGAALPALMDGTSQRRVTRW